LNGKDINKAKPADSCIFTNETGMESRKQVASGTSLARTSAAVIGLAISVGASSLLMPSKGDRVLAAEGPTAAESTSHNQSTQANAVATVLPHSGEATAATSTHSVGAKQLKGAAVWEISPQAEVDATSHTIYGGIKSQTFSPVADEKTTPSLKSIAAEENAGNSLVSTGTRQTTENEAQTTTTPKSVVSSSPSFSQQTTNSSSVNSFVPDESPIPGKLSSSEPTTSGENKPSELSSTTEGTQPKTVQSPVDSLGSAIIAPSQTAIAIKVEVYQVRDGDTLNSIAATYGVSVGEIIQINNLSNPNLLNVNQTLKIPQGLKTQELVSTTPNSINISVPAPITTDSSVAPTVKSVVESRARSSTDAALSKQEPVNKVTVPRVAQANPIPLTLDTSVSETPATIVLSPSATTPQTSATVTVPTAVNTNAMPLVVKEISTGSSVQQVKTAELNHAYGGRLRADLDRLYAESETQTSNHGTSVMKVAEVPHQQERQEPRNPEYQPQNSLPTMQKEMSSRQTSQWVEKAQNSNQEPSATTKLATSVTIPSGTPKPSLVATAPIGAEAYDPLNNPTLRRMVSPELPPLPGVDRYLPGGSPQSKGFIWPSKGELTSGYGWRWGRMHRGIDIAAPIGTPVVAADDGTVTYAAFNDGGYGYLVEITHPNGSVTFYAHNDRILVREGQQVTQGQQISEMGSTGFSTGPHLHFEVHPTGKGSVDPMAFLPKNPSVASEQ
jgi:murein DD-endopeptidase MepM/ murein hydrolase activator NlpD